MWYEHFGYEENPFSIKPSAPNSSAPNNNDVNLVGYEDKVRRLLDSIANGAVWLVSGAFGSGKTTLFKGIIKRYRGQGRVIYYSLNRKEQAADFRRLIRGSGSMLQRLFGVLPRDRILLLDEAHMLHAADAQQIVDFYKQGFLKAVVLAAERFDSVHMPEALRKLIGDNIIELHRISSDDAVSIARKRFSQNAFLSDNMIRKIFDYSHNNPRELLENCEDVCRYAKEQGSAMVTLKHLSAIGSP